MERAIGREHGIRRARHCVQRQYRLVWGVAVGVPDTGEALALWPSRTATRLATAFGASIRHRVVFAAFFCPPDKPLHSAPVYDLASTLGMKPRDRDALARPVALNEEQCGALGG